MNVPAGSHEISKANSMKGSQLYERLFLICDHCYWSASALPTRKSDSTVCPKCNSTVSVLPLSTGERYAFSYDEKRGVEVSFSQSRGKSPAA